MDANTARRKRPWAFVAGVVLVALGVLGHFAFAAFTGADAKATDTAAGDISLTLGGSNPEDNEFTIDATDLVAGDMVLRTVTLTVDGSVDASDITLTTTAPTSSALDTDPVKGLAVQMYSCSIPFTQHLEGGIPLIDSCDGDINIPLPGQAVILGPTSLTGLDLTPGAPIYLGVVVFLQDADITFAGLTSVIRFSFSAVQRDGTYK
jgi:hypothetical protein